MRNQCDSSQEVSGDCVITGRNTAEVLLYFSPLAGNLEWRLAIE